MASEVKEETDAHSYARISMREEARSPPFALVEMGIS